MTTDLSSKSVTELCKKLMLLYPLETNELVGRLVETLLQLELYAAEMSEAKAAGFYSASELWSAYQTAQQRNAAHDAKIAAEAKAEALEEAIEDGSEFGEVPTSWLRQKASEYRAKATEAGRKE